ncbi:MAG: UDP-N-acetylglucosamine 1-carboxyvinyltransferase [Pseudanabaenaceae cyanobacterium bins.39]|nr:UDP-N-acetylglucosamine 1-carboxyvinyltransferase [Pseudanabaenaceae cyanobacterium bins.39]
MQSSMDLGNIISPNATISTNSLEPNPMSSIDANAPVLRIIGKAKLAGHVPISGAKNSILALMAGSLLSSEGCRIRNVPHLADVKMMSDILESLGVKIERNGEVLDLDTSNVIKNSAPYELVSKMRASFFALGSILARLGSAKMPLPGGCAIGARPVELHVRGLQALGADVQIEHGIVHAHAKSRNGRLQGARIYLDCPSVGATETLMMAATLAEGETVIENAAQEPEVVDLADLCIAMGAEIRGAGTNTIIINGVDKLHYADFTAIPDRIEAATFMVAAAITRSTLTLSPVVPAHLTAAISKLQDMGVTIRQDAPNMITVIGGDCYRAVDIETLPYPGFPTDMQAPFMALLTLCEGNGVVTETVYENRLQHVAELNRMGANIRLKNNVAVVTGVPQLSGAPVMATDLRASAALVLAGLAADGETTVMGLHHLDRGYDRIEAKLRNVGAQLYRTSEKVEA